MKSHKGPSNAQGSQPMLRWTTSETTKVKTAPKDRQIWRQKEKMRTSQYAFRIFDKETRSAICLFAHILSKLKYLLTLLALPQTSRDTLSGKKRETAFTGSFLRPVLGTEHQSGFQRTLYSFQAQCCVMYREATLAFLRKGPRRWGFD